MPLRSGGAALVTNELLALSLRTDCDDSNLDATLACKSASVVAAVQRPLNNMLTIGEHQYYDPFQRSNSVITLHFKHHPNASSTWSRALMSGLAARHITAALQAMELLLNHAARLSSSKRSGILRSDFWMQLIRSGAMHGPSLRKLSRHRWMVEQSNHFPLLVVFEFRDLNAKQMDAVRGFFVRSERQQHQHQHQRRRSASCAFGLSFRGCKLSMACLLMIQQLLNQVAAQEQLAATDSRKRYGIHMLELTHNELQPAQLDIVTDILSQNHAYKLCDIRLTHATQRSLSSADQSSLLRLTRAAFSVTEDMQRHFQPPSGYQRRLSLKDNPLDLQHIATICSSLRYGCVYEEMSLVQLLGCVESTDKLEQCWRWIAFGLFYSRSKRFASSFRLRSLDLSQIRFDADAFPAFARTMANPVAEFRSSRDGREEKLEEASLVVCNLKRGATIYSLADKTSTSLMVLDAERAWEALYTRDDTQWMNVVVPGHGLGWVEARQVLSIEREELVPTNQLGLVMDGVASRNHVGLIDVFMETIGHLLRSLKILASELSPAFVHCSNLEHLNLESSYVGTGRMRVLIDYLQSDSARQLQSLNLNDTIIYDEDARALGAAFNDITRLPKLRELRLKNRATRTKRNLASLSAALAVNKVIAFVELDQSRPRDGRDRVFDVKHHGESVEMAKLPLSHKLAFISAVTSEGSSAKMGAFVERWIFEQIFDFAGLPVQRTILWSNW